MTVYILYFGHECMNEILGVYDSKEKAQIACASFIQQTGSSAVNYSGLVIVEKKVE